MRPFRRLGHSISDGHEKTKQPAGGFLLYTRQVPQQCEVQIPSGGPAMRMLMGHGLAGLTGRLTDLILHSAQQSSICSDMQPGLYTWNKTELWLAGAWRGLAAGLLRVGISCVPGTSPCGYRDNSEASR